MILRTFSTSDNRCALTAKHKTLVLSLQQHQNVLEQNNVQVDLLRTINTPRQWTLVQHLVLRHVQLLQTHCIIHYASCRLVRSNVANSLYHTVPNKKLKKISGVSHQKKTNSHEIITNISVTLPYSIIYSSSAMTAFLQTRNSSDLVIFKIFSLGVHTA